MRKSLLADDEIVLRYAHDIQIQVIAKEAGISRQAVRDSLKRSGVYDPLHGSSERKCRFCEETFRAWRGQTDRGKGNYCSIQCFHADRSVSGEYSKTGGRLSKLVEKSSDASERQLGRRAQKVIEESGIKLRHGEVVHHVNGDRNDNRIENLIVFKNHSEHIAFHHSLRHKAAEERKNTKPKVKRKRVVI